MSRKKYINEIHDWIRNEFELTDDIITDTGTHNGLIHYPLGLVIAYSYQIGCDDDFTTKLLNVEISHIAWYNGKEITDPKLEQKIKNVLFNQIIDKIN